MAYSVESELLLGNIPLPSYLSAAAYIQDADDEIDSQIGHLYDTPLDTANTSQMVRPARLLIKRLSKHLATGRIILAVASPEENKNLHAYGWSLVQSAQESLAQIASGAIPLPGAAVNDTVDTTDAAKVPVISNLDAESNVEAFYDRVVNPNYVYPYPTSAWTDPDRFIG